LTELVRKNCLDCEVEIILPLDIEEGEIVSCQCCGTEYEIRDGQLVYLTQEGEDWGE
jgi:hypothetical protein